MVNGVLEGNGLTAEPVAIKISDGEELVGTMMRSMQDSKTMEVVTALQQDGIRTTSGEFELMGSGFILSKGYTGGTGSRASCTTTCRRVR